MSLRHLYLVALCAAVVAVVGLALPAAALAPTPTPSASASGSPSPTPSATPTPSPSSSPTSAPTPSPQVDVQIHTSAPLLGQVGDLVGYSIELDVSAPVHDLIVVGSVPIEMDITALPLNDRVEAMTSGTRGQHEDIVWVINSATPRKGITLQWTARVTQPGDLVATAIVEARVGSDATVAVADTFLAAPPQVATKGVAPAPRVKGKIVRFVPVETAAPGSIMPVTGWSPAGPLGVAFACFALGALLIIISLRRPRLQWAIAALVLLSVTAACTPVDNPQAAPESSTPSGPAATPDGAADKAPRDRVLGTRIHNNEPVPEPTDDPASTAAGSSITYRRVVTVAPQAPTPRLQPGRASDNQLSFEWDEPLREVQQATSGVLFTADQPSTMTVGLSWDDDGLSTEVRLANTSSRALRVSGSVVLEIARSGGAVSRLTSEPLDVVLAPGGEATVSYRYLLPTGEYSITGIFKQ